MNLVDRRQSPFRCIFKCGHFRWLFSFSWARNRPGYAVTHLGLTRAMSLHQPQPQLLIAGVVRSGEQRLFASGYDACFPADWIRAGSISSALAHGVTYFALVTIGIVYGAMASPWAKRFQVLVGYSSVSQTPPMWAFVLWPDDVTSMA